MDKVEWQMHFDRICEGAIRWAAEAPEDQIDLIRDVVEAIDLINPQWIQAIENPQPRLKVVR